MPESAPDRKSIFGRALELSATDRPAYLDAACAGHPALRAEVEELLRAYGGAGSFLNAPLVPSDVTVSAPGNDPNPTRSHHPADGQAGKIIADRYKLLQQIGEGGMGTVWMADQTVPIKRRVAVKLIRVDRGTSKTILSRFEAERQAIALMNHPNIAKLLDAGTTDDGAPYFVMELVKGVPLAEYCDAHKLSVPDRLDLFRQICSAVHHAHQKGVIHRDLKPTNILVESHDGKPVPKVIDFGLAKATTGLQLTEHTLFTAFGTVAGTPLYMAPEQATFNAIDMDSRADIYSLGVILYELLSGSTPIHRDTLKTAALDEMLRVIREQEPPPPSSRISTSEAKPSIAANRQSEPVKLGRFVKGELDWIVMKSLAKERDRRYESATAFAADVERFLAHEPVSAGPPSQWYRLRKFVRRNKGRVVAASLVLGALWAGIAGTSIGLLEANRAKQTAKIEEQKAIAERDEKVKALEAETVARQAEADARNKQALTAVAERQAVYDMTIPLVQRALDDGDQPRAAKLLADCPEDLRGWEWHYLNRQFDRHAIVIRPAYGPTRYGRTATYVTPDNKELMVLTVHSLGLLAERWNTTTGKKIIQKELSLPVEMRWFTVSPDRQLVAVWAPPSNVFAMRGGRMNPNVPKNVPASARSVQIYDLRSGDRIGELIGHTNWIYHVLFSEDSKHIVTGSSDQTLRFWDTAGKPGMVLKGHTKAVAIPLAFTPDGKSLIAAGRDFKIPLPLGTTVMWKPDSTIRERDEWFVWDLETQTLKVKGDLGAVPLQHFAGFDPSLAVSADGSCAILPTWLNSTVVDLTNGQRLPLAQNTIPLGFESRGKAVLMLNQSGVISKIRVPTPSDIALDYRLSIPSVEGSNGNTFSNSVPPWSWNLSRDGRILAIGRDREKKTVIVDTALGGEIGFVADARSANLPGLQPFVGARNHDRVIANDGSFMTSTDQGGIKLWRLGTSAALFDFDRFKKGPDGKVELPERFKGPDGKFKAPDVRETQLTGTIISPDGRYVLTQTQYRKKGDPEVGDYEYHIEFQIRDGKTREVLATSDRYEANNFSHLQFDPSGRRVIGSIAKAIYDDDKKQRTSGYAYTPIIWDTLTAKEVVRGKPIAAPVGTQSPHIPQITVNEADEVLVVSFVSDDSARSTRLKQGYWQLEVLGSGKPPLVLSRKSGQVFQFCRGAKLGVFVGQGGPNGSDAEIWNLEQGEIAWRIPGKEHRHQSTHAIFSYDGSRLFLFDGQHLGIVSSRQVRESVAVTAWDIPGKKQICTFNPPREALFAWPTAMDRTGSRILCGTTIWNATTGRPLIEVTDGKLPNERRRRETAAKDPDLVRRLFAEAKEAPRLIWKPSQPVSDIIAEATAGLDKKSDKYDPAKSLELLRQALDAYPIDRDAMTAYGESLVRVGRPGEAIPVLEKVLRIHDSENTVKAGGHVTCFHLAMAHHALGQTTQANDRFREGVARHIMLLANLGYPPAAAYFRTRDGILPGNTPTVAMIEAAQMLGVRLPSLSLDSITRDSDVSLRECLIYRAMTLALNGKMIEAMKVTEECVANEPLTSNLAYNAACMYSLSIPTLKADPAKQRRHSDRAMELLTKAIALGWQHINHLNQDRDLEPLRNRDEFKKLMGDLEGLPTPNRELAPQPRLAK